MLTYVFFDEQKYFVFSSVDASAELKGSHSSVVVVVNVVSIVCKDVDTAP